MTESSTAKPATKRTTKKAVLDFKRPYGYVVGNYPECPRAKLTQDGKFFNLKGEQVGEVPEQTSME